MNDDDEAILRALTDELRARHGCHTVVLYGSRARGDATPESDWDMLAVRDGVGAVVHDAREHRGAWLDAFVYPTASVDPPPDELLRLRGGRVVCERDGLATRLLAALDARFAEGPPPWPPDEERVHRAWVRKMLARASRGDAEANYRRAWLLTDLLETHFRLRRRWYPGSRAALAWLREHDPASHRAFERALRPGASLEEVAALVERVLGG